MTGIEMAIFHVNVCSAELVSLPGCIPTSYSLKGCHFHFYPDSYTVLTAHEMKVNVFFVFCLFFSFVFLINSMELVYIDCMLF